MAVKSFTIKAFKPIDLEQVVNINRKCLPENYSSPFFMDLLKQFPKTSLVAEENGEVVGYAICRIETETSNFRLSGNKKKGHIISIAILPDHRRQGIGYALVREIMRAMKFYKAETCFLEVRKSNTPAINLYKKMGFKIVNTIRNYYIDGEGCYKMMRKTPLLEDSKEKSS
jgi:ribosomal-protein-alanine N-acetyltransferase